MAERIFFSHRKQQRWQKGFFSVQPSKTSPPSCSQRKSFTWFDLVQKPEGIYNLKLYCDSSDRGTSPYSKTSRHVPRPKEKGPWDNLELFYSCQTAHAEDEQIIQKCV